LLAAPAAVAQSAHPAKKTPVARSAARASYDISGIAVNELTNEPAPHMQVFIGLAQKQNILATMLTGSDGHFVFHDVAPAKYWLAARGHGFAQQGLDEHEGSFTGIAVGPGQYSQNITFRLRPDSSIVGTITDENEPVVGAEVMLFHAGIEGGEHSVYQLQSTASTDEGRYHFGHLPAGAYYIVVS